MIAIACFVAVWVAGKEGERKGIDKEKIGEFSLYAIIGAIIGARLYYEVFSNRALLWDNPFSIFFIWQGGLAIHGGILGGLLVSILYTR